MITVEEARERLLNAFAPLPAEVAGLDAAAGRVLAADVAARRDQPPVAVSAMDGYAVRAADVAAPPARLAVTGTSAAGEPFAGPLGPGEAVRIYTGAAVPDGADAVVMQEDTERDGATVTVNDSVGAGRSVRPAGLDFAAGDILLTRGRPLDARAIGLAAAMNRPWLPVVRRPRVAVLSTGDELALPGEPLGPTQICGSNGPALAAMVTAHGGEATHLGIAGDDRETLEALAGAARGADLLVTSGGVSVGDHDIVRDLLGDADLAFHKVAMRPGKPLMFGHAGGTPVLGLPGNPVSALVTAALFLRPVLRRLHGLLPEAAGERVTARLATDLPANDLRRDHLRATLTRDGGGTLWATPLTGQDSGVLSALAAADALIVRPEHAPAAAAGDSVEVLTLPEGLAP